MNIKIKKLDFKIDSRGKLAELLRPEDLHLKTFGQLLVTTALPKKTKGGHYHKRKYETYIVIAGKGLLTLVDIKTKEKMELVMGEDNMICVEIPPNVYHSIKNIGNKELILLCYTTESFNGKDPDTYVL